MIQLENLTPEALDQLWPQGRGELLGFANYLDKTGASITADQIRLALQMAQKWYEHETQNAPSPE